MTVRSPHIQQCPILRLTFPFTQWWPPIASPNINLNPAGSTTGAGFLLGLSGMYASVNSACARRILNCLCVKYAKSGLLLYAKYALQAHCATTAMKKRRSHFIVRTAYYALPGPRANLLWLSTALNISLYVAWTSGYVSLNTPRLSTPPVCLLQIRTFLAFLCDVPQVWTSSIGWTS